MQAIINYFSGTGNTLRVVLEYQKYLEQSGYNVTLNNIEKSEEINFNIYDLFFIAYPVYAFNAPKNVLNFVKKIKRVNKKTQLVIIKTEGEALKYNNISSLKLISILKRKNFILSNEFYYCMPYNIIFKHSDYMAFKMLETMQKAVEADCYNVLNNIKTKLPKVFLGCLLAFFMRIHHVFSGIIGRSFKVDKACTKCMMCVKKCPTQNIIFKNDKFIFKGKCLTCMRCIFHCPANAFRIGILESWRVNGPYSFKKPDVIILNKNDFFCYKSYRQYFQLQEEKYNNYLKQKTIKQA